jgi:hypothetical protein
MRSIGSAAAAGVAAVALAVVGAVAVLAVWRSGGAAAGWIESLFRREDYAEMLASHYLRAVEYAGAGGVVREELVERTVRALRDAGDRALSLHAYPLAAGFYERAMALQPDGASGPHGSCCCRWETRWLGPAIKSGPGRRS